MVRLRALIIASHPGPSLAITAMATVLAAEAARRGIGPLLTAPAVLAGQFSIGWSNDACDAPRDIAAGRGDKPAARGEVSVRALWTAAAVSAAAGLALAAAISPLTLACNALLIVPGWAYNLGLKSTPGSGLMYLLGFAPLPALAASTLPGSPAPRVIVCVAAALVGLGAHFVNVLPDLSADLRSGVHGLPQLVAARWGPGAARGAALALLLGASVLLVVAASPGRRWIALAGLGCSGLLAVAGALGGGRTPFRAALAIAGVDVAVFAAGAEALTAGHLPGPHLTGLGG
jgi:4-hydroxybenzoate polyprenyltransferase